MRRRWHRGRGRLEARIFFAPMLLFLLATELEAQVYGYTDKNGVLVLSNVPTNDRMRLIADGTTDEAGKVWRYDGQYDALILKASRLFAVDSALVRAVIAVESAFNRYAHSHKGARGLMQLMPATGRQYGLVNPYDPWQNIRAGTAHLRNLMDEFDDLRLALAAYNAGATPVRRHRGIPPYRETRDYVRRVMAIYQAGGKIEIRKGGQVYSISSPGARTTVSTERGSARAGVPRSLGELARRQAARATPPPIPPQPAAPQPALSAALSQKRVYYRYTDADGVVVITRTRPTSPPFEILEP